MRHRLKGRQLSRDTEHRIALRRNMAQSLFEHGRIRTTLPKAKEVQGFAEKLITLAKRAALASDDATGKTVALNARRRVIQLMQDRRLVDENQEFTGQSVVQKLFSEIGPKFTERPGGYTRIIKLAKHRIGDGGSLVQLELVTATEAPKGTARKSKGLRRKKYQRRAEFANKVLKAGGSDKAEVEKTEAAE